MWTLSTLLFIEYVKKYDTYYTKILLGDVRTPVKLFNAKVAFIFTFYINALLSVKRKKNELHLLHCAPILLNSSSPKIFSTAA